MAERRVLSAAQSSSRRSAVAKIGTMMVGGAVLPMLPFDRSGGEAHAGMPATEDPMKCEYRATARWTGSCAPAAVVP